MTQPIPQPERGVFQLDLTVAEADIDMLDHASNIAFVRWIQDVALAHSAAVGLTFQAYQRLGAVFMVVRHEIDYLRPALRGDALAGANVDIQRARGELRALDASWCAPPTSSCSRERSPRGASSRWRTGRPRRIPEEVRVAFRGFIH